MHRAIFFGKPLSAVSQQSFGAGWSPRLGVSIDGAYHDVLEQGVEAVD